MRRDGASIGRSGTNTFGLRGLVSGGVRRLLIVLLVASSPVTETGHGSRRIKVEVETALLECWRPHPPALFSLREHCPNMLM